MNFPFGNAVSATAYPRLAEGHVDFRLTVEDIFTQNGDGFGRQRFTVRNIGDPVVGYEIVIGLVSYDTSE